MKPEPAPISPIFCLCAAPVTLLGEDAIQAYADACDRADPPIWWQRLFSRQRPKISPDLAARRLAVAFETAFLEAARPKRKRQCPLRPFWERVERELNDILMGSALPHDARRVSSLTLNYFRRFVENQPKRRCTILIDDYRIMVGRSGYLSHQRFLPKAFDFIGVFALFSAVFALVLSGVNC